MRHVRTATLLVWVCVGVVACGSSTPPRAAPLSDQRSTTTDAADSSPGTSASAAPPSDVTPVASTRTSTTSPALPTATGLRPCRAEVSTCRGELVPGPYSSIRTDLNGTGAPGQVRLTVPWGWANTLDHQPAYWLRPAEDYYADPAPDGNDTSSGIYVWGDVAAARQGGACAEVSDTSVKTDARSLVQWMRTVDGLRATPLPNERISGRTASVLDLQLTADPPLCDGTPYAVLIASRPSAPDPYGWGVGAGDRARLWLIDLGGGHTAAVFVIGPSSGFPTLLTRAIPILDTLRLATS